MKTEWYYQQTTLLTEFLLLLSGDVAQIFKRLNEYLHCNQDPFLLSNNFYYILSNYNQITYWNYTTISASR